MKKNILISILLISTYGFSQEMVQNSKGDTIVLKSDKTWEFKNEKKILDITIDDFKSIFKDPSKGDGTLLAVKKITVKDGADNNVLAEFSMKITDKQLNELDLKKIKEISDKALLITKYKLKNQFTFIPRRISWDYNKEGNFAGTWSVQISYSAQNDYGALKDGYKTIWFNSDGTEFKY